MRAQVRYARGVLDARQRALLGSRLVAVNHRLRATRRRLA
jgi:hypothetical protein